MARFHASGQSKTKFCEQNATARSTLILWERRLAAGDDGSTPASRAAWIHQTPGHLSWPRCILTRSARLRERSSGTRQSAAYADRAGCAGTTRRISRVTVKPWTMMENTTTT